jgi:hypothetical protein
MKTFNKKLILASAVVIAVGGISVLFAQNLLNLTTDLANPVQYIGNVILTTLNDDGSWLEEGKITMSAQEGNVTMNGSLLTNQTQQNEISGDGGNVSLLGGKENVLTVVNSGQSSIIGGETNTVASDLSTIIGGYNNRILGGSTQSVILGGEENTIVGSTSTILGGKNNTVTGGSNVILGEHNSISGANSLAAGSGVRITRDSIFARNDGTEVFTVNQPNLFAINAIGGIVVGSTLPHQLAVLKLNGNLRV